MKRILTIFTVFALLCIAAMAQKPNTLSNKEKKEGWKMLFDGKNYQWLAHLFKRYSRFKMVGQGWNVTL